MDGDGDMLMSYLSKTLELVLSWQFSGYDFIFQCRDFDLIPVWGARIRHASRPKKQNMYRSNIQYVTNSIKT